MMYTPPLKRTELKQRKSTIQIEIMLMIVIMKAKQLLCLIENLMQARSHGVISKD